MLEAAHDGVKIVPSGLEAQIPHITHHGIEVLKSSDTFKSTIQLRHNDLFLVNNFTFKIGYRQHNLLSPNANVVDLELDSDSETESKSARELEMNDEATAIRALSPTPIPIGDGYIISETPILQQRARDVRPNNIDIVSTVACHSLRLSQNSPPNSHGAVKHEVMTAIRSAGAKQEIVAPADSQKDIGPKLDGDVSVKQQDPHAVFDTVGSLKPLQNSSMLVAAPSTFAAIGASDTPGENIEFLDQAVQLVISDFQASGLPMVYDQPEILMPEHSN